MNCSHCGAKNEENARFCADCGTPLEGQTDTEVDNDRTIMSSVKQISEEAKTVAVSQDDLSKLANDMAQAQDAEFEPETTPPSPPSTPTGGSDGGQKSGFFTQRNIIIMVVVLLALCLCCCVLAGIGGWWYSRQFSSILPVLLSGMV